MEDQTEKVTIKNCRLCETPMISQASQVEGYCDIKCKLKAYERKVLRMEDVTSALKASQITVDILTAALINLRTKVTVAADEAVDSLLEDRV